MKKKHAEHVNHERWLVSYADFITLLFAFFVIMYAISQADIMKFRKVSQSIKTAFGGLGNSGAIDLGGTSGGDTANMFERADAGGGRVIDLPAGRVNTASEPDPALHEIREKLEETLSLELGESGLSDQVMLQFDTRGLVVSLAAKDFFEPGQVEVHPDLVPLLDRIGRVLSRSDRMIRIEGHADADEPAGGSYPSNWELSAARAAWVAKHWLKRFEMNPRRIGVAGYAHYRPLKKPEKSGSEWARRANRRLEVIVLNQAFK